MVDKILSKKEMDERISETPYFMSWDNGEFIDSLREEGDINYEGLDLINSVCLYIYAWNKEDFYPRKRGILKKFNITDYEFQKIRKEISIIRTAPTVNPNTGLLNGSGYVLKIK